jgi:hypothetical protein
MAYSYTPAFIAFCGGAPPEEIADEFKIPLKSLLAKIRQEGWRGLANRMSGCIPTNSMPNDDALNRIEANRGKNYESAAKLREDVMEIIAHLREGTLRIKKQFHNKGQVVEYDAVPSLLDRLNIAAYARTVTEMTYRALGDFGANGGFRADAGPAVPPPAMPITIVLPDVIARPRQERSRELERIPGVFAQ